ncbi:MAG: hypothetical protein NTW31_10950, partial [Bacteroidetes bacterium]|nr:hypothetical protein [Bacteroidota bacterium]
MQKSILFISIFALLSLNNSFTDCKNFIAGTNAFRFGSLKKSSGSSSGHTVRVVFWNVENLYDTYDDTTKLDNDFTSQGLMHWNYKRFHIKLN